MSIKPSPSKASSSPVHLGADIAETIRKNVMRSAWPARLKVGLLELANGLHPEVEYVDLTDVAGLDGLLMCYAPIGVRVPGCAVWMARNTGTGEMATVATFAEDDPLPTSGRIAYFSSPR